MTIVCTHLVSFGWRKFSPENSIWNTAVPLLSYSCMFQVEISSQELEICKSVCMFILLTIVWDWLTFSCFVPIMTSWRKDQQSWMPRQARTHSWQWLLKNLSVSCRVNHFFVCNYSYVVHTEYIYIYFFFLSTEHCAWAIISPKELKSWVTCTSFALLYWKTEFSAVKYFAISS